MPCFLAFEAKKSFLLLYNLQFTNYDLNTNSNINNNRLIYLKIKMQD